MNMESSKPRTILVVEDETFVREVTCEILRSAGYLVLRATNATEAQNVFFACDEEIAVLVTDIVLPGENGHALAARLKQFRPSLQVLFATGYPEEMSCGVDCLAKPFSAAMLLESVAGKVGDARAEFCNGPRTMRAYDSAPPPECAQKFPTAVLCG